MFQFLSDYARSDQGQGHVFMPCFTGRRASSRSYVVFWVSPKWSHSFPGRHRSPLGLAPFVIDTPSVDVMGHARQASSTYARFDRLDIASGGRQRPSHFHPIVDTHPHTHTPIFSTQSSLVVTHACAVGTALVRPLSDPALAVLRPFAATATYPAFAIGLRLLLLDRSLTGLDF